MISLLFNVQKRQICRCRNYIHGCLEAKGGGNCVCVETAKRSIGVTETDVYTSL